MRLGICPNPSSDWNADVPFADLFRAARPWFSQVPSGNPFNSGPALALDQDGNPTAINSAAGDYAQKYLLQCPPSSSLGGLYTVTYDGQGTFDVFPSSQVSIVSSQPGQLTLRFNPAAAPVTASMTLLLKSTVAGNPARNFRCWMPGLQNRLFNPAFLATWAAAACVRGMWWQLISVVGGNPEVNWTDRSTLAYSAWQAKGVPLEMLVALCNVLGCACWVNVPHQASDSYVTSMAALIANTLAPGIPVYVEYSNECWNYAANYAAQTNWCAAQGAAQPEAKSGAWKSWQCRDFYYGRRCAQIQKLFNAVGRPSKMVVAGQAGDVSVGTRAMQQFVADGGTPQVIAFAPYAAYAITSAGGSGIPPASTIAGWTVNQLMQSVQQVSLPLVQSRCQAYASLAQTYGAKLACYECGPSVSLNDASSQNNAQLAALVAAANDSAQMQTFLLGSYFPALASYVNDVANYLTSRGAYSPQAGYFSITQAYDDTPQKPGKLAAWNLYQYPLWSPQAMATLDPTVQSALNTFLADVDATNAANAAAQAADAQVTQAQQALQQAQATASSAHASATQAQAKQAADNTAFVNAFTSVYGKGS